MDNPFVDMPLFSKARQEQSVSCILYNNALIIIPYYPYQLNNEMYARDVQVNSTVWTFQKINVGNDMRHTAQSAVSVSQYFIYNSPA